MKKISQTLEFFYVYQKKKKKKLLTGQKEMPKYNCCSVAFKSLNIAPLGRKEDSFLGSRQPCTKLYS